MTAEFYAFSIGLAILKALNDCRIELNALNDAVEPLARRPVRSSQTETDTG